jgi:hypothetical protein
MSHTIKSAYPYLYSNRSSPQHESLYLMFSERERMSAKPSAANAREARAVPSRKSDINDAQWLQRLHACGLLRASFRPRAISGKLAVTTEC